MSGYPFQGNNVARVYESYPLAIRKHALSLRALIFDVAKQVPDVGRIEETLKWGEPAYIAHAAHATDAKASRLGASGPLFGARTERVIGSAVRVGWKKSDPNRYRLLFHCQTTLVDSFREQFPNVFTFEGNRAIVFGVDDKIPERATSQCIAASLTYRLDRTARR
jgi:hypothetical protein